MTSQPKQACLETILNRYRDADPRKDWYLRFDEERNMEFLHLGNTEFPLHSPNDLSEEEYKKLEFIIHAPDDVIYLIYELSKVVTYASRALERYDNPLEKHNKEGGFPRPELAWAMASDLREALK